MRYPLVAFLVVFVLGPYTAHAVLTGSARFQPQTDDRTVQVEQRGSGALEIRQFGGGVLISVRQLRSLNCNRQCDEPGDATQ